MKMKRKIMMTTALAATLATGALPSTSVFAAEKRLLSNKKRHR